MRIRKLVTPPLLSLLYFSYMKHIYHGTNKKNLVTLIPQKRFTPGDGANADSIPPRVYATYNPAFAVTHSFAWSSDDGIDIGIVDDVITLIVPHNKKEVLNQEVCVYTLPDTHFVRTSEEETGLTFHTESEVVPIAVQCFENVTHAMETFGGKINFV